MKLRRLAVSLLLLSVMLSTNAVAGTISLTLSASATIREKRLSVVLDVRNGGDEAALSISPVLHFGDWRAPGVGLTTLPAGATHRETLDLSLGEIRRGRWPYRVAVDYTDANRYPLQALMVGEVTVDSSPPALLLVSRVETIRLAERGKLEVELRNMGPKPTNVKVSLFGPLAIEIEGVESPVSLDGWEQKTVSLDLINRTALPGSALPLTVVAEYDDDLVHQSVFGTAIVEVLVHRPFWIEHRAKFAIAGLIMVLGWFGLLLRRRRPKSS